MSGRDIVDKYNKAPMSCKYGSCLTHSISSSSLAGLTISEQSGVKKLTKHFDFSVHRLRDEVEHSHVSGLFVPTYDQIADVFTVRPIALEIRSWKLRH